MELNLSFDLDLLPEKMGVYFVGGTVRDILQGQSPVDFDIAVAGNPEKFAETLAARLLTRPIMMGKPGKEAIRIVSKNLIFDVVRLNGASIDEDLKLRDFTVNAMAWSLSQNRMIDPFQGRKDLKEGVIRMVSGACFKKDPIRLLRAFRFAAALGFAIEPNTFAGIKTNAALIMTSAGERTKAELFKLLESDRSYPYLRQMESAGLLFEIFPPLKDLVGCRQNRHHAFDVFHHTLCAYHAMEHFFNHLSDTAPGPDFSPIHHMDKKRQGLLKFAVLLHDIGKPSAASQEANGTIHFYGHGQKSAAMARTIGKTLRLSVDESNYLADIIENHNRPRYLFTLFQKKQLTQKAIVRFFLGCGERTPDILLHAVADHLGKGYNHKNGFVEFAMHTIRDYFDGYKLKKSEKPFITGHDLIDSFGLTPSPLFRKILTHIEESRLADIIKSRGEALAWVKSFLAHRTDSNA
jgi:poly(A) polymerase